MTAPFIYSYDLETNKEDNTTPSPNVTLDMVLEDVFGQRSLPTRGTYVKPLPSAPTGLKTESFLETVTITWDSQSVNDHFKLYRHTSDDVNSATCIADAIPASATAFIDKNVQSALFYYWLVAVDAYGQESGPSTVASITATMSLLDLELMKMMFTTVSWGQFAVFESFNDEDKRASPDPSTYDAEVGGGWLDNGDDDTPNREFGFVSKEYTDITIIDSGTSTDVGVGYLEDTSKSWYDTQYNNLTLIDSASTEFTINDTVASTHRLEVTGTPAAGAYEVKTANADYCLGLCSFRDSTNGGYGYVKLEASFNGGSNWQTVLDTEADVDIRGGTVAISNKGDDYKVRCTIKNDGSGNGAIMYKFMVFTGPSVWVSTG